MSVEIISLNEYKDRVPLRLESSELQKDRVYAFYARLEGALGKAMSTLIRLTDVSVDARGQTQEGYAALTTLDDDFVTGLQVSGRLRGGFWVANPTETPMVRHTDARGRIARMIVGQGFFLGYDDGVTDWDEVSEANTPPLEVVGSSR